MFADDGVTGPGEAPPPEHVKAVKDATRVEDARAVGRAHREGNEPPGHGGTPPGQSRGSQ
ncbi:hypothetical protein LPA44_04105 [Halobacterium sp. KA-4]|uniref:hypothetical protein n=1 Tax=Halobacterium sp. KA-4 TaxID=2896367 RepID=UPI001E50F4C8|nr:hypothetical protein [Halobacterium sp. KA-4]MCD2199082.1 hypothetical protein [Halobacterium sp. KA-4]